MSIESSYNKVAQTTSMVMVAQQVLNLRQESERLAQNQLTQGVLLVSAHHRATAATFKAQADFLQAKLGNLLAWAQLQATIGLTPGL